MTEEPFDKIEVSNGDQPSTLSRAEYASLESTLDRQEPNSVRIDAFGIFSVKWHAENGVSVFCFMLALCVLGLMLALAIWSKWLPLETSWLDDLFKVLGQAMLTLIGAVVGSSANGLTKSRINQR